MNARHALTLLALGTAFAVACSDDDSKGENEKEEDPVLGNNGQGGQHSGSVSTGSLLEGVNGVRPSDGDGSSGSVDGGDGSVAVVADECTGVQFKGEGLELDLVIMMDRSISMGDSEEHYLLPGGGTKWDATEIGLDSFLDLPAVQNTGVSIDYFGQGNLSPADVDCDAEDYSTPEVPMGEVAETGDQIRQSFAEWEPAGPTPLEPALGGALLYAQQHQEQSAGRSVAVVLITDGIPHDCKVPHDDDEKREASINRMADRAEEVLSSTGIRTFVLGIADQNEDFKRYVRTVAEAGGTEAVIVDAADDLATKFADALNQIRAAAAPPCAYSIPLPPSGEELNHAEVNVVLEPTSGSPEAILKVAGPNDCEYGGWYYEPAGDPESIQLCPNTCNVVSTLKGAGFRVVFGCATVESVH